MTNEVNVWKVNVLVSDMCRKLNRMEDVSFERYGAQGTSARDTIEFLQWLSLCNIYRKQRHHTLCMMAANLIGVFKTFPKELFRVNNGHLVQLRQWMPKRHAYDVHVTQGMIQAKALHPCSYQAPNSASMRPNSPYQQHLVARLFKGQDVMVYAVPPGTPLPNDLLLVHERSDHYSL
ncbi:hypothetical protein C2857_000366 [Epichloe festucae Fl1]|uniref:Tse2 ADP-ribosyltransferase toxin domain-containing protein n=1 Tax=Epichloe festucae (strain Fl1) TaxID=877507 RepID=A0A7S9PWI5_EPIFF|nr:hypothetical protein C2857_000366 [Epichloe festucae Fl1]